MKSTIASLATVLLFGGSHCSQAAVLVRPGTEQVSGTTILWHNSVFDSVVDSNGAPLNGSFTVELGIFVAGFEPVAANVDLWLENWWVFDQADFNPATGYFTGEARVLVDGTSDSAEMTPGATGFEGKQAFLWIRNSDVAEVGSEWLLLNDQSWDLPDADTNCCNNGIPVEWAGSDLDSADTPIFGSQGGVRGAGEISTPGNFKFQTATFVVPEPSSAGLLLMASLGLLRRKRK